ncbi:MAG: hypothetical protein H0U71_03295 [Gammaproteobacteria bacterium]|nr:hypothetical protein [Gammaproteobacteria bacterium]
MFETALQELTKITQCEGIAEIKSLLERLTSDTHDQDSLVEKLRKLLQTMLIESILKQQNANANNSSADVIHNILILLAEFRPINDVDPIMQDTFKINNAVYISTGQKFNIKTLIKYHKMRDYKGHVLGETEEGTKWLLNPLTNSRFLLRDALHIQRVVKKKTNTMLIIKTREEIPRRLEELLTFEQLQLLPKALADFIVSPDGIELITTYEVTVWQLYSLGSELYAHLNNLRLFFPFYYFKGCYNSLLQLVQLPPNLLLNILKNPQEFRQFLSKCHLSVENFLSCEKSLCEELYANQAAAIKIFERQGFPLDDFAKLKKPSRDLILKKYKIFHYLYKYKDLSLYHLQKLDSSIIEMIATKDTAGGFILVSRDGGGLNQIAFSKFLNLNLAIQKIIVQMSYGDAQLLTTLPISFSDMLDLPPGIVIELLQNIAQVCDLINNQFIEFGQLIQLKPEDLHKVFDKYSMAGKTIICELQLSGKLAYFFQNMSKHFEEKIVDRDEKVMILERCLIERDAKIAALEKQLSLLEEKLESSKVREPEDDSDAHHRSRHTNFFA